MSNGVRHLIGVVVGLVAGPAIYLLISWSMRLLAEMMQSFSPGVGAFLVFMLAAALVGLLAGSRGLSGFAPLVAGLMLLAVGLVLVAPYYFGLDLSRWLPELLQREAMRGFPGTQAAFGVTLIVSALFPHRWTATKPAAPPYQPHSQQPPSQQPYPQQPYSEGPTQPYPGEQGQSWRNP